MTAVRGDLIATVTGTQKVDPETLSVKEWEEIINAACESISTRNLSRMEQLDKVVKSSDLVSGIPSTVEYGVWRGALGGLAEGTAFLLCAHLAFRPNTLPGKAKHVLMSRSKKFYELEIEWEMGYNAPILPRYYEATRVELAYRSLESLLEEYGKLQIGTRAPRLFGHCIISALHFAQQETVEHFERELESGRKALIKLTWIDNILKK